MYAKIIKKIDDIPELRNELASIFDSKSHKDVARYSLLLGQHILNITNTEPCIEIVESFDFNKKWQEGIAGFQYARQVAFKLHKLAHDEKDPIKEKVYRVMIQVATTPHVKNHAMIASDYAVKLINKMYPNNFDEIRKEREIQIELMKNV